MTDAEQSGGDAVPDRRRDGGISIPPGYRPPASDDDLRAECDVAFFLGPGPGGQHRNRNRTAVRLVHRPTGLTAVETRQRSQSRNLSAALNRLRERLTALTRPKRRRIATRPSRAARERRLESKRRRARTKTLRRSLGDD